MCYAVLFALTQSNPYYIQFYTNKCVSFFVHLCLATLHNFSLFIWFSQFKMFLKWWNRSLLLFRLLCMEYCFVVGVSIAIVVRWLWCCVWFDPLFGTLHLHILPRFKLKTKNAIFLPSFESSVTRKINFSSLNQFYDILSSSILFKIL